MIGAEVEKKLKPLARRVQRIEGPTPVQNAIEFARFQSGELRLGRRGAGLELHGRGHLAAARRRGAAALATNGVFAPLLLTDDAETLPDRSRATCSTSSRASRTTRG